MPANVYLRCNPRTAWYCGVSLQSCSMPAERTSGSEVVLFRCGQQNTQSDELWALSVNYSANVRLTTLVIPSFDETSNSAR
jgi:hypothetical protein